ncbi:hypothetical protein CRYUN_Cryun08bG0046500 [Craigia yunnanensis]
MVENCTRKLMVEICNAKNLMPKDGQGTTNAYVIVDFDGQRRRTKIKFRDLNLVWDEKLEFLVHDIESMATEILEINLYNDKKIGKISTFLGKVKLAGSVFVKAEAENLIYYLLEKMNVFSQIKGEIRVKVFYVDEEVSPEPTEAAVKQKVKSAEEKPPENSKPKWYSLESDKSPENDVMVFVWIGTWVDGAFQKAWHSDSSGTQVGSAWNEVLVFVATEPFFMVTIEDVSNGQSLGQVKIHVPSIERRTNDKIELKSRWFSLVGGENKPYTGRIHVRVCLEGGYHMLDEAAHVTSDDRAPTKQLAKAPIGLLEVGIRRASNLLPVKIKDGTRGTTDAYVLAKYGPKWVHIRTILNQFNPHWNEQYTWNVYDSCIVLTIGVFDNGRYNHPLGPAQQDILCHMAMRIVTTRLARFEPPLGQEMVQFMLDSDTHVWSMRRSKANWIRVVGCFVTYGNFGILVRWDSHVSIASNYYFGSCVACSIGVMSTSTASHHVVGPDELDEEFDGLPTTRSSDTIRIRYDRLRALAGRAQTLLGDVAAQVEHLKTLFNWRGPRATAIFVVFCLFASSLFYVVPFKVFVLGSGFYYIRHPRFINDMPSIPINFFR